MRPPSHRSRARSASPPEFGTHRRGDTPDRQRRGPPLWLPWLVAPAFMLLPIGGCGLAESFVRGDPRALQSAPPAADADAAGAWRMAAVGSPG